MQRRQAEAVGQRVIGNSPSRTTRGVSFSQIDPAAQERLAQRSMPLHRHDQDESMRLLQRLRQALHPWSDEQSQASKDYESLQDELQRLAQHMAKQKSPTPSELWDHNAAPYRAASEEGPDRLPYRTIKIVSNESQSIERLDVTPFDLSRYRQVFQETPAPARTLTLVPTAESPAPQLPDLLIEEEVQLGHATANLTQQSLETSGTGKIRVTINPKVALSLLDT
jgi:hypothetical protein